MGDTRSVIAAILPLMIVADDEPNTVREKLPRYVSMIGAEESAVEKTAVNLLDGVPRPNVGAPIAPLEANVAAHTALGAPSMHEDSTFVSSPNPEASGSEDPSSICTCVIGCTSSPRTHTGTSKSVLPAE